jgi:hypothetical protein
MQFVTRWVKGIMGVVIGSVAFAGLMLPIEILGFGIDPKGDIGIGMGISAFIIGGVAGGVLLSKAKWWTILALFVVVFIMFGILMKQYPQGYSAESDMFTAEVDGISFDASRAYAKYASGWLDISAVDGIPGEGEMKIIMFHLYCSWTGSFTLNSNSQEFGNGAAYSFGNKKSSTIFTTNSSSIGKIKISALDLNAKKVSGTFEYRAIQYNPPGSRVVKVTGFFKDIPIR